MSRHRDPQLQMGEIFPLHVFNFDDKTEKSWFFNRPCFLSSGYIKQTILLLRLVFVLLITPSEGSGHVTTRRDRRRRTEPESGHHTTQQFEIIINVSVSFFTVERLLMSDSEVKNISPHPFKPEFTSVIIIHYKPRIAVAILNL